MGNIIKTTALMGLLTVLLVLIGDLMGGQQGMVMMLLIAAVMNVGMWYFSDTLAIRQSGAVPVQAGQLDWLQRDLAELSRSAGIPTPRLYLIPHERSPNAFATGRSPEKGVVAVTAGLLDTLSQREVKGVLAHELGHIKHRDTLISTVAATMAGALTFASRMLLWTGGGRRARDSDNALGPLLGIALAILAPMAALLIRMMVSRTREYMADERAAQLTGDPEGLALALEGLSRGTRRAPMQTGSESTHYIVNGFGGGMASLFSTHPPIEERVRRLRAMRF